MGNLSAISSLQILDLTYNEISSLPGNFSQFPKLEVLCLENNKLKSDAIKSLATAPKLKELNLSQNLLDNFPPSTLHAADSPVFRSLQKLNLANNNFCNEDSLKSLQNIPSLTHVMIWGNPIRKKGTIQYFLHSLSPSLSLPFLVSSLFQNTQITISFILQLLRMGCSVSRFPKLLPKTLHLASLTTQNAFFFRTKQMLPSLCHNRRNSKHLKMYVCCPPVLSVRQF